MSGPIRGVIAASVTPLTADGDRLDEAAVGPLTDFLHRSGLDGLLAMGTTGEGVLLTVPERRRLIDLFVQASAGRLKVIVHCGAQSTRDTVELAAHSGAAGANGVAVIGPPYFVLDSQSILEHFTAAARACAPLPFFIYEFADRSGYRIPVPVIEELRGRVDNLAGLKVSDSPWERFEPYLIEGLSIFVGSERLISRAMGRGAAGAVSALASALPELVIDAVRTGRPEASERCGMVRDAVQRYPFQAALKTILAARGIPITRGVRSPLRTLSMSELAEFEPTARQLLVDLPVVTHTQP